MAKKTIKLKAYGDIHNEYDANAAITPGMLIELMITNKVRAHSSAGNNALPMFALENDLQGNDIDDAYSEDDKVQCWIPRRGDEVFAILADGENVAIGQFGDSNGDGYLRRHVVEEETWAVSEAGTVLVRPLQIVCIFLEAKDLSGSSGAESSGATAYNKRIKVRII
jgi:hypothetical protein